MVRSRKIRTVPKKIVPKEDYEQIVFVNWLKKNNILFTASANGGKRDLMTAMKLKRMGVSAGFPDIFIPVPKGGYHGLFIELKRIEGGVVSSNQLLWINRLRSYGYYVKVCEGAEIAKKYVDY
jgi:hypothetical protein